MREGDEYVNLDLISSMVKDLSQAIRIKKQNPGVKSSVKEERRIKVKVRLNMIKE